MTLAFHHKVAHERPIVLRDAVDTLLSLAELGQASYAEQTSREACALTKTKIFDLVMAATVLTDGLDLAIAVRLTTLGEWIKRLP